MHTHSRARRIRRAGVAGVLLAVTAVLAAATLLYRSQAQATEAAAWVRHTHQLIETLDALEIADGHAEIAVRDRLLLGSDASAAAYRVATARADAALARALDSTRDNLAQQRRLHALAVVLHERFAEGAHTMARLDARTPATAVRLIGAPHGADAVRRLLAAARASEAQLLADRRVVSQSAAARSRNVAMWALALGLGVALVSFWVVRREAVSARESEQRYRLLFAHSPRPTWVYDVDSLRFLAVNPAAVAFYGYSEREFLALTIADIRPDADREAVRAWAAEVGGALSTSIRRHRTKDGRDLDVQLASHALTFAGRAARLVVAEDVTDRRRLEAQLQDLALRDALTGLTNRRGFEQLAAHEIGLARRAHRTDALLYLDLDGFKEINDSFGHAAGDEALREVARVLRAAVRDHDIVARLGGDELVVYVAGLQRRGEGECVAARLHAALAAHNREAAAAGRPYGLAFSTGVAELGPNDTLATLLARADAALYQAKQARYAAA
jgi:diguanylate cyclase (GGDEF)-like protein/PAS domain S-box-containing protein